MSPKARCAVVVWSAASLWGAVEAPASAAPGYITVLPPSVAAKHAEDAARLAALAATAGASSPEFARVLATLADAANDDGDAQAARTLAECVAEIELGAVGEGPETAASLMRVATLASDRGDYAAARTTFERALAIRETALAADDPAIADTLNQLASVLMEQDQYERSAALAERARTAWERAAGPGTPEVAEALNTAGRIASHNGDYVAAWSYFQQSLAIRERNFGPAHPKVNQSLSNLGEQLFLQGDFRGARRLFERVVKSEQALRGHDDPVMATLVGNLAAAVEATGDFVAARPLYERALAIDEKAFGPDHPDVATDLNNFGSFLYAQGDYASAIQILERALAIREKVFGQENHGVGVVVNNLAMVYWAKGDYATARPLLERALAIEEKRRGREHPRLASYLNNLASLLIDQGDAQAARPYAERSLAILEKAYGHTHPDLANPLTNLVNVDQARGNFDSARTLGARALAICEAALGSDHPEMANILDILATGEWRAEGVDRARPLIERAASIVARHVNDTLPSLSLAEQRAFLQANVPKQTSYLLSSHTTGESLAHAYGLLFRWKGLLIDALRRQSALARLADDPRRRDQVLALRAARTRIAGWFHQAGSVPLEEWKRKYLDMTREKEELERALARSVAPGTFEDRLATLGLGGFRAKLKPDEAFVDVYRYRWRDRGVPDGTRYAAIVLDARTAPVLVDLGPAEKIEQAVRMWRGEVLALVEADEAWDTLIDRVWRPIASALPPGTRRAWVSPDGELARIPWQLLPAALAQTRSILVSQSDSPRELAHLRSTPSRPAKTGRPSLLLAGGVDFDAGASPAAFRGGDFEALPGTRAEIAALEPTGHRAGLAVTVLAGDAATKESVTAALARSTYAHLATHGFFCQEAAIGRGRGGDLTGGPGITAADRNPLVESGIALAGANVRDAATQEAKGLLTAEDLVGIDLSACRMVTLSACETGRGEEVTGQGVMGLRAAVLAAGARTLVMSLWMVPDEATEKLMRTFYAGLWQKHLPAAAALRQAQEAVRDDPSGDFRHPVHWAGWAIAGEGW